MGELIEAPAASKDPLDGGPSKPDGILKLGDRIGEIVCLPVLDPDNPTWTMATRPTDARYEFSSWTSGSWRTRATWTSPVQADVMVDRLVYESVRINLGDVNVRKLFADRK